MPRLLIATVASVNPMGAQRYQAEIAQRAPASLPGWDVRISFARSMRSDLPGDRRLPLSWLRSASPFARRRLGALIYPRNAVVHRMDLDLPPGRGPNVVTIHDTVSWVYPDETSPVRAAAEEARRADAVICVSQYSANQVHELLGVQEPRVIYNGVDSAYSDAVPLDDEQRRQLGLERPYVLHAGGASQRKNLGALAAAWPRVAPAFPDHVLALAGPAHPRRTELFAPLDRTVLLGRLPDELMPALVASAEAVVVPSTYEGFGLPALEAMAAGTPVVVADASSLPEVVGDAGIVVDPGPDGIAEGLRAALADGPDVDGFVTRGRVRAAEFTWERSAREHATVWLDVAG
jgi:glycosyltransferase involved in cell wall biosynthesis